MLTHLLALAVSGTAPQGFHTSWSEGGGLYLTWSNVNSTAPSGEGNPHCTYRLDGSNESKVAVATSRTYSDKCDGPVCTSWVGWVRNAEVPQKDAAAAHTVTYRCGDDLHGYGAEFTTKGRKQKTSSETKTFLMFADVGTDNGAPAVSSYLASNPEGIRIRERASYAIMLGDIAYTRGSEFVWDYFLEMWQPLLSGTPTLFTPGNHDGSWVFGNNYQQPAAGWVGGGESGQSYSTRLPGPGAKITFDSPYKNVGKIESTSYWWSAQHEGVYMIATSGVHEFEQGSVQYAWLEKELAKANTAESRKEYPWVIVTNHFPIYCTIDDCFCGNYTQASREQLCEPGHNGTNIPGILEINAVRIKDAFEGLLLTHQVDVFLSGHEHAYERTKPVANLVVPDSCKDHDSLFKDPGAPLHVMAGTGGGSPDYKWRTKSDFDWSVTRSDGAISDMHPEGVVEFSLSQGNTNLTGRYINLGGGQQVVRDTFTILKTL